MNLDGMLDVIRNTNHMSWGLIIVLDQYFSDPDEYYKIEYLENNISDFLRCQPMSMVKKFIVENNLNIVLMSRYIEEKYLSEIYDISSKGILLISCSHPNISHDNMFNYVKSQFQYNIFEYIESRYDEGYILELHNSMIGHSIINVNYYDLFDYMNNCTTALEGLMRDKFELEQNEDLYDLYLSYTSVLSILDDNIIPLEW